MQRLLAQPPRSPCWVGEGRVHTLLLANAIASPRALPAAAAASAAGLPASPSRHRHSPWAHHPGVQLPAPSHAAGRAYAGAHTTGFPSQTNADGPSELSKRNQVVKRLQRTSSYFKRLGGVGFWAQLVCTVVSAVILAFSVAISGKPTSQFTFYFTAGGIAAAFLSVFWSFGYIRLSHRLQSTMENLAKAPPRAEVVKNLKNGIIINLFGTASTILGMQATVGFLVAKALTSAAGPYLQGAPSSYSPVLALDVFLVQASANTLLSHFLGLLISLELLRSVTLPQPPPENVIPKLT